eukprot:scaffold61680_cov66-Phaeocystis_antarctica.AAC.1
MHVCSTLPSPCRTAASTRANPASPCCKGALARAGLLAARPSDLGAVVLASSVGRAWSAPAVAPAPTPTWLIAELAGDD